MKPTKYFVQEISQDGFDCQYRAVVSEDHSELNAHGPGWTQLALGQPLVEIDEDSNTGDVVITMYDNDGGGRQLCLSFCELSYLHALLKAMNFHEKRFNDLLIGKVKRVRT